MVNLRAQPRCSVKAILKLGMTTLHVGAPGVPSVPVSAAKEAVDVPGLKSVRCLVSRPGSTTALCLLVLLVNPIQTWLFI